MKKSLILALSFFVLSTGLLLANTAKAKPACVMSSPTATQSGGRTMSRVALLSIGVFVAVPCLGQEPDVRKFPGSEHLRSDMTDAAGKQLAIFLNPTPFGFQVSDSTERTAAELIKAVAVAPKASGVTEILAVAVDLAEMFKYTIDDTPVSQMVHIVLLPGIGIKVSDKKWAKGMLRFEPGSMTLLKDVQASFGDCTERELWSSKILGTFGLDGIVYWWGSVGLAADAQGAITHVLIRWDRLYYQRLRSGRRDGGGF